MIPSVDAGRRPTSDCLRDESCLDAEKLCSRQGRDVARLHHPMRREHVIPLRDRLGSAEVGLLPSLGRRREGIQACASIVQALWLQQPAQVFSERTFPSATWQMRQRIGSSFTWRNKCLPFRQEEIACKGCFSQVRFGLAFPPTGGAGPNPQRMLGSKRHSSVHVQLMAFDWPWKSEYASWA